MELLYICHAESHLLIIKEKVNLENKKGASTFLQRRTKG
jgi:hypothetical protein